MTLETFEHPEVNRCGPSKVIGMPEATLPLSLSPSWVSLLQVHPHQVSVAQSSSGWVVLSEDRVRAVSSQRDKKSILKFSRNMSFKLLSWKEMRETAAWKGTV